MMTTTPHHLLHSLPVSMSRMWTASRSSTQRMPFSAHHQTRLQLQACTVKLSGRHHHGTEERFLGHAMTVSSSRVAQTLRSQ